MIFVQYNHDNHHHKRVSSSSNHTERTAARQATGIQKRVLSMDFVLSDFDITNLTAYFCGGCHCCQQATQTNRIESKRKRERTKKPEPPLEAKLNIIACHIYKCVHINDKIIITIIVVRFGAFFFRVCFLFCSHASSTKNQSLVDQKDDGDKKIEVCYNYLFLSMRNSSKSISMIFHAVTYARTRVDGYERLTCHDICNIRGCWRLSGLI